MGGGDTFKQRFAELPRDAIDRRARSNAVMREEGVTVNEWLPVIESEQDVQLPSTEEVAMRAVAALMVAMKGHGMSQDEVGRLVSDYALTGSFSRKESQFITDPAPSERERQTQTWRYEAANALLWSLGFVERLDGPRDHCDPNQLIPLMLENTREQFLAQAKLKSASEILDQADLIYRYRWALVDSRVNGQPAPAALNDDVAMERHHAFNWLIYHAEEDWDDISLDT